MDERYPTMNGVQHRKVGQLNVTTMDEDGRLRVLGWTNAEDGRKMNAIGQMIQADERIRPFELDVFWAITRAHRSSSGWARITPTQIAEITGSGRPYEIKSAIGRLAELGYLRYGNMQNYVGKPAGYAINWAILESNFKPDPEYRETHLRAVDE